MRCSVSFFMIYQIRPFKSTQTFCSQLFGYNYMLFKPCLMNPSLSLTLSACHTVRSTGVSQWACGGGGGG